MILNCAKSLTKPLSILALASLAGLVCSLQGQTMVPGQVASEEWRFNQTIELTGLSGRKGTERGSLSLSHSALIFSGKSGSTSIERAHILAVTAGDERKESGGTAGKISRLAIPFGGGSALAATVTNKEVGLLTIEFRDENHALHDAVFQMSKADALQAQQDFAPDTITERSEPQYESCERTAMTQSDTVRVAASTAEGIPVPAEYRALLYERLIDRLREEKTFLAVYRDGDTSAAASCPEYQLTLQFEAFTKGNAALRASTGPVGFLVGATNLKVHALMENQRGNRVLDQEVKVSQRGDTESLNVADKIAKSLNNKLTKQLKNQSSPGTNGERRH